MRGEYVSYLYEGQRDGEFLYANVCNFMREHDAQVFGLPQSSIDSSNALVELDGANAIFQLIHRRAVLRCPSVYTESMYERMVTMQEAEFIELLAQSFRTLTQAVG